MTESAAASGSAKTAVRYAIGDLVVDLDRRRVRRAERALAIRGLSFDLLVALARHAPEVVSLDRLIDEVWRGRVINDETVAQRVKLLREALGDDSRNPRYVAVERGRGYRLIAPVEPLVETEAVSPASQRSGFGAVLLLLLSLAVLWTVWPEPSNDRGPPDSAESQLPEWPDRTIAVLPFARLGASGGDAARIEVLAFGLAEAVLHRLTTLPDLTVIAPSSSLAVEPEPLDARVLGRRLGARYLVRGSVLMAEGRLRITAQLIDSTDGSQLWSEQFDRAEDSFFSIESDIAQRVTERLRSSVAPLSGQLTETTHFDAFLAFQRARRLLLQRSTGAVEQAIDELDRALAIDPDYARAHLALAEAWALLASLEGSFDAPHPRYRETLERALALDPGLGDAWILLATVEPERETAEAMVQRGLALNPSSSIGHDQRINRLIRDLRFTEALETADRAMQIDPLAPRFPYMKALIVLNMSLAFDEAERWLLRTLELDPSFQPALFRRAQLHSWNGEFAEAVLLGEQALALDQETSWVRFRLAQFQLDLEDVEAARRLTELDAPWMGDVLVPLYRGEHARAAAVARADPGPAALTQRHPSYAQALLADIEAGAAAAGSPDRLMKASGIELGPGRRPLEWPDLATAFALVRMLRIEERPEDAELLLGIVEAWLDQRVEHVDPDHPWLHRHRAVVHALRGRDAAALAALERAFDGGARAGAWYTLDHDPAFERLRSRPEFIELKREHREWVELQQARLADQRRRVRAF